MKRLIEQALGVRVCRLAAGMHSTAYREVGGERRVFLVSRTAARDKDVIVRARRRLPRNAHLPKVEFVGSVDGHRVYVMPFYRAPLTKATPDAYVDYRILKACRARYYSDARVINCAEELGVTPGVIAALRELKAEGTKLSWQYTMEFCRRNLATDAKGRLVLLDVVYNMAETELARCEQKRKARARARARGRR